MNKIINIMATAVFVMALFGVVAVASATDKGRFVELSQLARSNAVRQLGWLLAAVGAGLGVLGVDYRFYRRPGFMLALFLGTLVLLALVFAPVFGHGINGSHRWVNLGPLRMQPSEFAKLAMVALTCAWIDRAGWNARRFKEGIMYPGAAIGFVVVLLLLETDVGATVVLLVSCGAVLFAAGARLAHLLPMAALGLAVLVVVMLLIPNRRARVMGFVNEKFNAEYALLDADRDKAVRDGAVARDHARQALEALRNGGMWGVGYMNSSQKKFYLREAHTDFIAAIIGEEFGFAVCLLVLLGYGVILVCGMVIAHRAPDRFGRLLAFGMTFLLAFQAAFNLGVVADMLPTKGIALPFLSYGGSSLVASMVAVGVILNVGHKVLLAEVSDDANVFRDAVKI